MEITYSIIWVKDNFDILEKTQIGTSLFIRPNNTLVSSNTLIHNWSKVF